jgi:hypothetical protein
MTEFETRVEELAARMFDSAAEEDVILVANASARLLGFIGANIPAEDRHMLANDLRQLARYIEEITPHGELVG